MVQTGGGVSSPKKALKNLDLFRFKLKKVDKKNEDQSHLSVDLEKPAVTTLETDTMIPINRLSQPNLNQNSTYNPNRAPAPQDVKSLGEMGFGGTKCRGQGRRKAK